MSSIHLIRHGHAGHRSDFDGPDRKRPLTKKGEREAAAIARELADEGIDLVWSSVFTRCRQTVAPLAEAARVEVLDHDGFTEGGDGDVALDALLAAVAQGRTVAACSHGDVIPRVVEVAVQRGARLIGPSSPAKGARYRIDVADGRVSTLTHVATPDV
jgi:broad specificity phosphatase PhoE